MMSGRQIFCCFSFRIPGCEEEATGGWEGMRKGGWREVRVEREREERRNTKYPRGFLCVCVGTCMCLCVIALAAVLCL